MFRDERIHRLQTCSASLASVYSCRSYTHTHTRTHARARAPLRRAADAIAKRSRRLRTQTARSGECTSPPASSAPLLHSSTPSILPLRRFLLLFLRGDRDQMLQKMCPGRRSSRQAARGAQKARSEQSWRGQNFSFSHTLCGK